MINVEEHKRQLNEILRNIPLSENDLNDLKTDCETKINQIPYFNSFIITTTG